MSIQPTITKLHRGYAVTVGVAILAKFPTEEAAERSLSKNLALYLYWSGSVCVQVQNAPRVHVSI